MSATAYVLRHTLDNGHSGTINTLAFSPDGKYLASGADDETVIIWNALLGHYLYRFFLYSPVDSLLWNPVEEDALIVGCQNGTLKQIRNFSLDEYEEYDIRLGSKSHIYCLDYNLRTRRLAVGMGTEVHITREAHPNKYSGNTRLPHPEEGRVLGDKRDRAVALRFDPAGQQLVVAYLNHGIRCYDVKTGDQVWRILPPSSHEAIGHATVSPDHRSVAVHNFQDGVHVYRIGGFDRMKPPRLYSFDSPPDRRLALQVAFIHSGRAILCGSSTGRVCIWEVSSGDFFQQLDHDGGIVMAIAGSQHRQYGFIATGSVAYGAKASVRIWRARIGNDNARQPRSRRSSNWSICNAITQPLVRAAEYFPSKQDVWTAFLTSLFMTIGFFLAWFMSVVYEKLPWKLVFERLVNVARDYVSRLISAGQFGWHIIAYGWHRAAEFLMLFFRSVLRWARIRALKLLGIPPHLLDEVIEA